MFENNSSPPMTSDDDRLYLLKKKVEGDDYFNNNNNNNNRRGKWTYFAAMIGSFSAIFLILTLILVIVFDSKPKITNSSIPQSLQQDALEAWGEVLESRGGKGLLDGYEDLPKMIDILLLLKDLSLKDEEGSGSILQKSIEKHLFSWLKGPAHSLSSLLSLKASYDDGGKGLVMSTGNHYFPIAVHAIKVIRHLGCDLPIEIFYMGKEDLSDDKVAHLNALWRVKAKDINESFDNSHPELSLVGFDIKPFTIMASSFEEAMFIDADIVFMENPSNLFEDKSYLKTGALFFYDRFFKKDDFKEWIHTIIRSPSKGVKRSHLYRGESSYEQDSGVLLVDKKKHFWAMLASLRLNCQIERDVIHSRTWGDKETFWLAFEMMGEDYEWYDRRVGTIGGDPSSTAKGKEPNFCGHMAHFTKNGKRLLWLQDSILEDKQKPKTSQPLKYEYYTNSGGWNDICSRTTNIKKIDPDQLALLAEFRDLWDGYPIKEKIIN